MSFGEASLDRGGGRKPWAPGSSDANIDAVPETQAAHSGPILTINAAQELKRHHCCEADFLVRRALETRQIHAAENYRLLWKDDFRNGRFIPRFWWRRMRFIGNSNGHRKPSLPDQPAMYGPENLTRTRSTAMNAKTLISALILSVAAVGAAQAANSEPNNVPFQGVYGQADHSASRVQVVAELQQVRAVGLTGNSEINNTPFTAQANSGVMRSQVVADSHRDSSVASTAFGDSNNEPFQGA